jgi:hypothetical protein
MKKINAILVKMLEIGIQISYDDHGSICLSHHRFKEMKA